MTHSLKDAPLPPNYPKTLLLEDHVKFLKHYSKNKMSYDYVMSEFLRINGVFWSLSAMDLMGQMNELDKKEV